MNLTAKDIIPLALATVDVVQGLVCIWKRDVPLAWYWFAAAQITLATVFMHK